MSSPAWTASLTSPRTSSGPSVADPTQDVEAEFGAECGGETKRLGGRRVEVSDPTSDHGPDARGDRDA